MWSAGKVKPSEAKSVTVSTNHINPCQWKGSLKQKNVQNKIYSYISNSPSWQTIGGGTQ